VGTAVHKMSYTGIPAACYVHLKREHAKESWENQGASLNYSHVLVLCRLLKAEEARTSLPT